MRIFISLSAAIMLAVVALTACNSSDGSGTRNTANSQTANATQTPPPATKTTQPTPPGDGVRRVTVAELREAVDKGTAVIVDVRSVEQYNTSHIKGALHIPEAEVAARSGELPRDKMIVTYCS